MAYVIEDNVPLPAAGNGPGGNFKGPKSEWTKTLDQLQPGQSVLATEYREYKCADAFAFRSKPRQFAIRKIAGQGWRVWRVA